MLTIQGGSVEALGAELRCALAKHAQAVPDDQVPALIAQVGAYLDMVRRAMAGNEFLNLPLAERIADVLTTLLHAYAEIESDHTRALVIGATRFFLKTDDVWNDLESPLGFDDDADVLNAVLKDIGRADLVVEK